MGGPAPEASRSQDLVRTRSAKNSLQQLLQDLAQRAAQEEKTMQPSHEGAAWETLAKAKKQAEEPLHASGVVFASWRRSKLCF